jgi:hypothetical protein
MSFSPRLAQVGWERSIAPAIRVPLTLTDRVEAGTPVALFQTRVEGAGSMIGAIYHQYDVNAGRAAVPCQHTGRTKRVRADHRRPQLDGWTQKLGMRGSGFGNRDLQLS